MLYYILYTRYQYLAGLMLAESTGYEGLTVSGSVRNIRKFHWV